MARRALHGLYVITDEDPDLESRVAAALAGGARAVQYRDKSGGDHRPAQAAALRNLCREHGALFLVNDDVALARQVGADGVHLGQHDTPLAEARAALGPEAVIGITCHGSLSLARLAAEAGADYVAFGRFFPSLTKPEAPPAPVSLLEAARAVLALPLVAIGGITAENGAALVAAGAHMLAASRGVLGQRDVTAAARALANLFPAVEEDP